MFCLKPEKKVLHPPNIFWNISLSGIRDDNFFNCFEKDDPMKDDKMEKYRIRWTRKFAILAEKDPQAHPNDTRTTIPFEKSLFA